MVATTEDVFAAATTEAAAQVADAKEPVEPKSAESAPAVTDTDEETIKVLDPVQKRIDELTRRRYDAERRADAAEQRAADRDEWRDRAMQQQHKPAPVVEEPAAVSKTLADFGYDEVAYKAHVLAEARQVATNATKQTLTQEREAISAAEHDEIFADRETEFAKKVPDYFEIARKPPNQGGPSITNEMAAVIKASEVGPAIANYLGRNVPISRQIARLPPLMAAMEMGKIAAKLSNVPTPPQVSGAPPPAPKITPSNAQVDKDPKDWTDKDFAKWREKHMK
jgi:hypothetical protein